MIAIGMLLWVIGSMLIAAEVSDSGGNMIAACAFNIMAVLGGYITGAAAESAKDDSR